MKKRKFGGLLDGSFLVFLAIAAMAGALSYSRGKGFFFQGLDASWALFLDVLPRLIGAFALAGFVEVLIPKDFIRRWVGEGSGLRGIVIATMAGVVTPGGPMVSFPLITALHKLGADVGPLVAYITSWELLGIQRIIVWEIPLMGLRFALLRFAVSIILPVIAGILARRLAFHVARAFHVEKV